MAQHSFCPSCGYPNDPKRGACILCYAMLHVAGGGSSCPSCGGENPKNANFCTGCQTALTAGVRPATLPDVSGLVGGAHGAAAPAPDQGIVGGHEDYVDFGEHDEGGDYVGHEPEAAPSAAAPAAFAPPPPPPAPPVAAPPPPPGAFTLDDDAAAPPPPPPGAVELDFDEVAPPPPPPAASAPAAAQKKEDEDLADWSLDYDDT